MEGSAKERWLELCELAANEQDPKKLLTLVTEINRLLSEKEEYLKANKLSKQFTPQAASDTQES